MRAADVATSATWFEISRFLLARPKIYIGHRIACSYYVLMGSNKRYGQKNIKPAWSATIGGMIKYDAQVQSTCRKCADVKPFPVEMFLKIYGATQTLIGHEGKCLEVGCGGSLLIQVRQGDHSPWRPIGD